MRAFTSALLLALALAVLPAGTASAAPATRATGEFSAAVDFDTLSATPAAGGRHCQLVVQGVLTFDGTLDGIAEGTTTAYVLAPCEEVLVVPPGAYRDVFSFKGSFSGTVAGTPATGKLTYSGITHPGGDIGATIHLRGSSRAVLRADATVAVGGTYVGVAKP